MTVEVITYKYDCLGLTSHAHHIMSDVFNKQITSTDEWNLTLINAPLSKNLKYFNSLETWCVKPALLTQCRWAQL